jgi:hypothetical protein
VSARCVRFNETDLYRPIAEYLTAQGYSVYGEVRGCDLAASRGDELVAVELKRGFCLSLIAQAVERQKAIESVYVAVPRPKGGTRGRRWRSYLHLLRRLELGLIFVECPSDRAAIEIVLHPKSFDRTASVSRGRRARRSMIREISGRSGDYNTGGSTRRKIMTAYRENAVHIACCIEKFGPLSPRRLRELGTGQKTQSILTKNHYGWFVRVSRGVYDLHEQGRAALDHFSDVASRYRSALDAAYAPVPRAQRLSRSSP